MAELLVLAFDTMNADMAKDKFAWKQGHVITIEEDGFKWGKQECLPKFYLVKLPGIRVDEAKKYLHPKIDVAAIGDDKMTYIRESKLDISLMPRELSDKMLAEGEVTIEDDQVRVLDSYMVKVA